MLIYGFRALYFQLENKTLEDDKRILSSDYDLILNYDEFQNLINNLDDNEIKSIIPLSSSSYLIKTLKANYDIHIVDDEKDDSNLFLYKNIKEYSIKEKLEDHYGNVFDIVNIKTLYEIKKSHRMIEKYFFKTMNDYYRISELVEDKLESVFYKQRLLETIKRANNQTKHINLKQNKNNFFNTKNINYIYDHDSIHFSIKLNEEPMYKKILVENEDVLCSEELWDKLSFLEKKETVLEEAYTIAIERSLSKYKNVDANKAFNIALEKICTTLCKGWFREFAYENYKEIKEMYSNVFWIKFQDDLKIGLIKSYSKK